MYKDYMRYLRIQALSGIGQTLSPAWNVTGLQEKIICGLDWHPLALFALVNAYSYLLFFVLPSKQDLQPWSFHLGQ